MDAMGDEGKGRYNLRKHFISHIIHYMPANVEEA
jgi:hypothetical protein